eukprot:6187902-Pleurochrysis_carterae.AAC.1
MARLVYDGTMRRISNADSGLSSASDAEAFFRYVALRSGLSDLDNGVTSLLQSYMGVLGYLQGPAMTHANGTERKQHGLMPDEYLALQEERFTCDDEAEAGVTTSLVVSDCAVCLTPFSRGQLLKRLPCEHVFCERCTRRWLEQARPRTE